MGRLALPEVVAYKSSDGIRATVGSNRAATPIGKQNSQEKYNISGLNLDSMPSDTMVSTWCE
jgi:hypothetical protein